MAELLDVLTGNPEVTGSGVVAAHKDNETKDGWHVLIHR